MQETSTLYFAAGGLVAAYALVSIFILPLLSTRRKYIRSQSWIGQKNRLFSRFRASLDTVMNTRSMVAEGYEKFSKNKKAFVLPQFGREPFLILPADKVHEFLTKGDDRVDHLTIGNESIAQKYTIGNQFQGQAHFDVVRRQLTRKLPTLTADVYSELVLSMKRNWPAKPDEWTTVKTYPTCMKIVSQAANRVFSGKELCRNADFLENSRLYAQTIFQTGAILKLVPDFLHPIVGPLVARPVHRHLAVCKKYALPVINDRLHRMKTEGKAYEPANDVLQWIIDDVAEVDDSEAFKRDPDWICRCMLLLNVVAIHTTSMMTTNTILDLYSSPHAADYVAGLREESERALQLSGGEWSKEAVNSLLRVDSTIRETMRISGLGELGIPRIVKDPKGITLSGGIHIPYGVRVVVPTYSIQTDSRFYPEDPMKWDGFRFSRPREAFAAANSTDDKVRLEKMLELKNRGLIVTTDDFFSFGFGKHSCPGRFFASQEMKLMMAYVVMTYDIKIEGGRPQSLHLNGAMFPRDSAAMQIRLRQ